MFNFTLGEKVFFALTKAMKYAQLESLVLNNSNAFNTAFSIWSKMDDQAHKDFEGMREHYEFYNRLSGALQI